jgi:hypothetical protein
VTDAAGLGDASFEWHEFAKVWQTPGAGERFFEQQPGQPVEERAGVFEQFGVPHDQALAMTGLDRTMAGCILALYRSAADVGRQWAPDFHDVPAPGLVVVPSEDPFLRGRERPRRRPQGRGRRGRPGRARPLVDAAGPRQGRRHARAILDVAHWGVAHATERSACTTRHRGRWPQPPHLPA